MKMTPFKKPLSMFTDQLSVASNSAVRVLWSDLNPDWQLAGEKTIVIQIFIKLIKY